VVYAVRTAAVKGILRGCRRQIARGSPVAVLASARVQASSRLTRAACGLRPLRPLYGTRGRTGREDGALGAISSEPAGQSRKAFPAQRKDRVKNGLALCQGYCNVRYRRAPPFASSLNRALSVGCPGVTGVAVGYKRWAKKGDCSSAAKLGARTSAGVPGCAPWGGLRRACQTASTTPRRPRARSSLQHGVCQRHDPRPRAPSQDDGGRAPRGGGSSSLHSSVPSPGDGVGRRQRTLDPDSMVMSRPDITRPLHEAGERRRFVASRSAVPVFFKGLVTALFPFASRSAQFLRHTRPRRLTVEARAVLRRNQLGRLRRARGDPGAIQRGR